ncbi:MAG TPA: transferrin receptor-like dimerization domain-containing protein [Pyrinomonadaceae bacterium]|nr:transferrin receptor-like dimerization domain-containing protein [Pyrinomonadaceae bacterium]
MITTRLLMKLCSLLLVFSFMPMARVIAVDNKPLLGFTREGSERERELEARFDSLLKRDDLREWMKRLSARPHHLGSAYDKENAEFIASQFRSFGFETEIETFDVLFPTPKTRLLEMTAPEKFTAKLAEPMLPDDPTSGQTAEQLPVYNAYSIDGDVTGQLVYVNYGVPKDYDALAERGIDVKGKIVIARYGGSWRGIKPKVAAEHGAIGCLIYSDPRDDGYFQGDVYPKGAWRNEYGAQRGSVADMPLYPGDPLTPGVGATKNAKRLPIKSAPTLTKIPVMPISYADALPLLRALNGPMAPEDWRGALPIPYHLGPGPATVHLKLEFDWKIVPANDVIARIRGNERPDEWIIRGNHHDAWVNGAEDPLSGLVAEMEEARAIGELVKSGWKPKRTIVYAAWDGEEPGLLGSTEWAETHADLLKKNAAVYINSDTNSRGFLGIEGSHTLEKFMNEVARDVTDPEKKVSVLERDRAVRIVRGSADERREARERADYRIGALGSGSDYTSFLDHLGIASLNLGYGGEGRGGSYHSIYDSFTHFTRFIDPNFDYGLALSQTAGRTVLRLANADVLPLYFNNLSDTIERYVREVTKLADDMREETRQKNQEISNHTLEMVADPTQVYVVPKMESPVPYLNFAPLQNSLTRLEESARSYDAAMNEAANAGRALSPEAEKSLDEALMRTERAMTREQGLPRRPWFKHQIYAPGFYTGYGVKTLPGVREAIEQRAWKEANDEVIVVAETLDSLSAEIDRATNILKGGRR